MLFKRFILLTCVLAAGGIVAANIIQATHPSRSTARLFNNCGLNTIHCINMNTNYAVNSRAS